MVNTKITFANGQELVADFYDLDFRTSYKSNMATFVEEINGIDLSQDDDIVLSNQMDALKRCIDSIWGPGEGDRVFCGKRHVMMMFEVMTKLRELNEAVNEDLVATSIAMQLELAK